MPQPNRDNARTANVQLCVAPWYSVRDGGFIPRIYVLDVDGWPVGHIDGVVALRTYDEAVEVARRLRMGDDEPTAA